MKLYYSPGACSLSPHIVLREASLTFDLEKVDTKTKLTHGGRNFLEINPKGQVPTLELDDGAVLTEGPVIVQYIADLAPASGLVPACGSMARYRVQEWLNFITAELHKGFAPLFKPDTPEAYKPIIKENLVKAFGFADKTLSTQPYLLGETFTVADAYLFVMLNWAKFQHIDLSSRPNLAPYFDRVRARPAVAEAMKTEGLK